MITFKLLRRILISEFNIEYSSNKFELYISMCIYIKSELYIYIYIYLCVCVHPSDYKAGSDTYRYTLTHTHKSLYKAGKLNLFWYLGKYLKPDTAAPRTGTTIKLETFYLSVGTSALLPKNPFVNILLDKLVIPDETWIHLVVSHERRWQFVSPSFCCRNKEELKSIHSSVWGGENLVSHLKQSDYYTVLYCSTTENKFLVFVFKLRKLQKWNPPHLISFYTHTHTGTCTHTHSHIKWLPMKFPLKLLYRFTFQQNFKK